MKQRYKIMRMYICIMLLFGVLVVPSYAAERSDETSERENVDLSDYIYQVGGTQAFSKMSVGLFSDSGIQNLSNVDGAKEAIKEALKNWDTEISLSQYDISYWDFSELYVDVVNYTPSLFYVSSGYTASCDRDGNVATVYPMYSTEFTKTDVLNYEETVEGILDAMPSGLSDLQKALYLHDYLLLHCEYDLEYQNYDAYDALVTGRAVCQGYALAYADLLDRVGVNYDYAMSDSMNHIWNYVEVDDQWYHVDVTWDDPISDQLGRAVHKYFLISDKKITELSHYNWIVARECTSKKYDTGAYWENIRAEIIFFDSENSYFLKGSTSSIDPLLLIRRDEKTGEENIVHSHDVGYYFGQNAFWMSYDARWGRDHGFFYYNDYQHVYRIDAAGGTPKIVYTYSGPNGLIQGMHVSGGYITLQLFDETSQRETMMVIPLDNKMLSRDGFLCLVEDDVAILMGYAGKDKNVVIPGTINGYSVVGISSYAFHDQEIESISIPDTVTQIGIHCFKDHSSTLTIYGDEGSYAEEYARKEGIPFKSNNKIEEFVTRCYTEILGRDADLSGLTYWAEELRYGRQTAAQAAASFVFSEEFVNANHSNEVFLQRLYATFFGREADQGGMNHWNGYLEKGATRKWVTANFVNSEEFERICTDYGMQRGTIILTDYADQNVDLTIYVSRCYQEILQRSAESDGLEWWCEQIYTGQKEATHVAKSFVESEEFIEKNLSNEDYVEVLYRAFMGRDSDEGGKSYWVGRLESGTSRSEALDSFAACEEFQEILRGFGL